MPTHTWTSGSGDWAGAGNWSPAGGPPDATTDGAILTGGTAPYTVTIAPDETFTAAGVTLDDPLATLDINGGLALAGGNIGVDAGTLLLDHSGAISGVTITPAGGTIRFDGGTLSATTWNGVLDLSAGNAALEVAGFNNSNSAGQSLFVTGPDGSPGTPDPAHRHGERRSRPTRGSGPTPSCARLPELSPPFAAHDRR